MAPISRRPLRVLALLAGWCGPLAAGHWQLQYFYDKAKSSLAIEDIQFISKTRGIAVGAIEEGDRRKPISLLTSDGGANWELVPLKEAPVSLFLLDYGAGWMVTEKGLWRTRESGRDWRKLPKLPAPIERVYFADENHGWAVGPRKALLETADGGNRWTPVAAAAEPNTNPEYTGYSIIAFANPQRGLVAGASYPPLRARELPAWMDPEAAMKRPYRPHLLVSLETKDGGKTWKSQTASVFGRVTRIRFGPGGEGMGLTEYEEQFPWPSEVSRIDWITGKSSRVYREKNRLITDIWMTPAGVSYLAGIELAGQLRSVVPGKIKVLTSQDYGQWTEMDVDYRAVASRVMLAGVDAENMWLATDTGMILKLVP